MEIIISNIQAQRKKFAMSQRKKSHFKRIVQQRVYKFIKHKNNNQGLIGKWHFNLTLINVIKIFILFVCTSLSLHVIYVRIIYYFKYPVMTLIEVVEDQFVHIPAVVVCTDSFQVRSVKQKIIEYKNLTTTCAVDLSIAELLDKPSQFAGNLTELWKNSSSIVEFKTAVCLFISLFIF
uniref:Uncharacterized protein n=1 Tax=Strigamia maritima TaxID=126957 RepID=T1IP82_STRMM